MSGASLVNMSYGHLAATFPVGSPGLPTPPQINGSPSPPSSHSRSALTLSLPSSTSPMSSPTSSLLLNNTASSGAPSNSALGAVGNPSASMMAGAGSNPASQPQQQCCENGRPVMTDPHTGQTVCSCQYSSALLSSYPRLPHSLAAPPSSLFGPPGSAASPYSATPGAQNPYMPLGAEGSAFYTPLGANGSNIRDGSDAWRSLGQPSLYDTSAMGFYPYGTGYGGLDLNARRKNATRESTNTLKAWLQEHIKNPYPTKGEKIMLAIITKMTLTQVSTWFANARRRLKKENKMTWSPRNRSEDGDDDDDDDNSDCGDDKKNNNNNNNNNNKDRGRDEHIDVGTEQRSRSSEGQHGENKGQTDREISHCRLSPELPRGPAHIAGEPAHAPPPPSGASDILLDSGKPKIWSVSDFLGSGPHKDPLGLSYPPKVDSLRPDLHHGMLGGQPSPLIGRSASGAPHAHNGLNALPGAAHPISSYQSTLGYGGGAYPYSFSSYGGGKFLNPAVSTAASARFSPFPPVRPLGSTPPTLLDVTSVWLERASEES